MPSEEDEQDGFDFGQWYCIVCERQIPASLRSTTGSNSNSPAHSPGLPVAGGAKHTGSGLHRKHSSGASAGLKRTKSNSRLHGTGQVAVRRGSHTNLTKLGPSTAIHGAKSKGKDTHVQGTAQRRSGTIKQSSAGLSTGSSTEPATAEFESDEEDYHQDTEGVGTVYCSVECKLRDLGEDQDDRGLASHAHLGGVGGHAHRPRHSTSTTTRPPAQYHAKSYQNGTHAAHASTDSSHSLAALDFSNRRNSRGASYRPLAMQRVPSSDDGVTTVAPPRFLSMSAGPSYSWTLGSNFGTRLRSSDSLASMGDDAGERVQTRSPSALSGLRAMTPIAGSHPSSSPSGSKLRPPTAPRHHTEPLKPMSLRAKSPIDVSRGERHARKRESRKHRSSDASEWAPQSVPVLGLEELRLSTRSTSRPPLRSGSSASLALLGSSFSNSQGRSFESRFLQAHAPQRSESSVSLSGLNVTGTILSPSSSEVTEADISRTPAAMGTPPSRPPASPRIRHHHPGHASHPRSSLSIPPLGGTSPSSPSSQSSFSHSTAHSSYLSSSAGSQHGHHHHHQKRGRTARNLTMTRSSSSLAHDPGPPASNSATPKSSGPSNGQPAPDPVTRANSTPATMRRPSIYQTAPTPLGAGSTTAGAAAAATALHNPSLSYLAPESAHAVGLGGEPGLSNKNRNFSWDGIGVKAYHVMDVDEIRGKTSNQGQHAGATQVTGLGTKTRKKLFHFPMDDDE